MLHRSMCLRPYAAGGHKQFDVDSVGDREGRMAMLTATRAKMAVVHNNQQYKEGEERGRQGNDSSDCRFR